MNVVGLVFSLLFILSYGMFACWEKQIASIYLRKTYVGHQKVNRKILNRYQSTIYDNCPGKSKPEAPKPKSSRKKKPKKKTADEEKKEFDPNPECARLNLWPLIQEGRENHPLLYELATRMLHTFYTPLIADKKQFETSFLDALLLAAKLTIQEEAPFALEKIDLKDPDLQRIYYKMLKGTKQWDLSAKDGYPSLLDYMKAVPSPEKLCVFHAHPDMITVLFGPKVASNLYMEIHRKKAPLLTRELVQHLCSELHQLAIDEALFELLILGCPHHDEIKKTFIARDADTGVSLKKMLYLKK